MQLQSAEWRLVNIETHFCGNHGHHGNRGDQNVTKAQKVTEQWKTRPEGRNIIVASEKQAKSDYTDAQAEKIACRLFSHECVKLVRFGERRIASHVRARQLRVKKSREHSRVRRAHHVPLFYFSNPLVILNFCTLIHLIALFAWLEFPPSVSGTCLICTPIFHSYIQRK